MDINQRNAIALNDEQSRMRSAAKSQADRITKLEAEIVAIRQELNSIRALAAASIGTGATSGNLGRLGQ